MMKKVFAILIGAALVLSMAGAVAATEITNDPESDSNDVTATFTISENYIVTIPDGTAELNQIGQEQSFGLVKVTRILIPDNKMITVSVSSDGTEETDDDGYAFIHKTASGSLSKLPYTLYYDPTGTWNLGESKKTVAGSGATIILNAVMTYKDAQTELFIKTDTDTKTVTSYANHQDTLTFTVALTAKSMEAEMD